MQAKLAFQLMALTGARTPHFEYWKLHNVRLCKVSMVRGEEVSIEEAQGKTCEGCCHRL